MRIKHTSACIFLTRLETCLGLSLRWCGWSLPERWYRWPWRFKWQRWGRRSPDTGCRTKAAEEPTESIGGPDRQHFALALLLLADTSRRVEQRCHCIASVGLGGRADHLQWPLRANPYVQWPLRAKRLLRASGGGGYYKRRAIYAGGGRGEYAHFPVIPGHDGTVFSYSESQIPLKEGTAGNNAPTWATCLAPLSRLRSHRSHLWSA